jgi:hypothetical protein
MFLNKTTPKFQLDKNPTLIGHKRNGYRLSNEDV